MKYIVAFTLVFTFASLFSAIDHLAKVARGDGASVVVTVKPVAIPLASDAVEI